MYDHQRHDTPSVWRLGRLNSRLISPSRAITIGDRQAIPASVVYHQPGSDSSAAG